MKNLNYLIFVTFIFTGIFVSCDEEEFLKEQPKSSIFSDNLFNSYSGFESGMNAVYALMRELYSGGDTRTRDQLWVQNTDDVSTRTTSVNQFLDIAAGWSEVSEVYNWLYRIINSSNMIINRAENNPDVDWGGSSDQEADQNRRAIISQARVARAWAYRLLIYAFGPVPLSTEEITGATYHNAWTRNPVEDIKAQMVEDLKYAVENLPLLSNDVSRINGSVARHYLGETYLSLGNFQGAIDVLKPLVESEGYSLVTSRIGRTADNPDGNYFMDMIRNPYHHSGNTETVFVLANGNDIPGSDVTPMMDSWIGEFRKHSHIAQNAEWYERFGGFGKARYLMTPWSMFNEEMYNIYASVEHVKDPEEPHMIDNWLWKNEDGRDNFLYEMSDIRGDGTSIRRYWVYDFNGNGTITDPPTHTLEETLMKNDPALMDKANKGDTLYGFFIFKPDNLGNPNWHEKHTYLYSRKWEVDATTTVDFSSKDSWFSIPHIRIAESYLLYAEALFMNGNATEAVKWINMVRERSNASTIEPNQISIDFILDERSRELIGEEQRKITLLRTGKFLERTRKYNPMSKDYVQDYHKLYPFPSDAIDANKDGEMKQNDGYTSGTGVLVDFTPPGYPDEGKNP